MNIKLFFNSLSIEDTDYPTGEGHEPAPSQGPISDG